MNELENYPFHSDTMAHYDACYGGHDINAYRGALMMADVDILAEE